MSANRTDHDGDSQMQSSSDESDPMFPEETGPSTPLTSADLIRAQAQAAALSPPGSQEQAPRTHLDDIMDTGELPSTSSLFRNSAEGKGKQHGDGRDDGQPGWGWQNQKAKEDYERSYAAVLDRDFDLCEFGELFTEQEIFEATGLKL